MDRNCDKCKHRGYLKHDKFKTYPFCTQPQMRLSGDRSPSCISVQSREEIDGNCPYKEIDE